MSLTATFDHDQRRGFGTFSDVVSYQSLEDWMIQVVRNRAQEYPKLIDGTGGHIVMEAQDIHRFHAFARSLGDQWLFGPVAVLVADETTYSRVHTLGLMTESICPLRPFFAHEDAEAWLAAETTALAARKASR